MILGNGILFLFANCMKRKFWYKGLTTKDFQAVVQTIQTGCQNLSQSQGIMVYIRPQKLT